MKYSYKKLKLNVIKILNVIHRKHKRQGKAQEYNHQNPGGIKISLLIVFYSVCYIMYCMYKIWGKFLE